MASTTRRSRASKTSRPVEATVPGNTILTPPVREALTHADAAPLHGVPKDSGAEATLARAESLLGRGQLGPALKELATLKAGDASLAGRYAFLHQEKLSRAQIGIAQRYVARGDLKNARSFYEQALKLDAADATVQAIGTVAAKAFDELMVQRATLIAGMTADIKKNDFTQWCGRKKTLGDLSVLDLAGVRQRIYPDFRLEDSLGERPPLAPRPGYVDPLPVETDLVAFTSGVPGAVFRAAGDAAIDVDAPQAEIPGDPPGDRVHASLAFPVLANVLKAKLGLFALDQGLSVTGQARGLAAPLPLRASARPDAGARRRRPGHREPDAADPVRARRFRAARGCGTAPARGAAGRARGAQPEDRRADPDAGAAGRSSSRRSTRW